MTHTIDDMECINNFYTTGKKSFTTFSRKGLSKPSQTWLFTNQLRHNLFKLFLTLITFGRHAISLHTSALLQDRHYNYPFNKLRFVYLCLPKTKKTIEIMLQLRAKKTRCTIFSTFDCIIFSCTQRKCAEKLISTTITTPTIDELQYWCEICNAYAHTRHISSVQQYLTNRASDQRHYKVLVASSSSTYAGRNYNKCDKSP